MQRAKLGRERCIRQGDLRRLRFILGRQNIYREAKTAASDSTATLREAALREFLLGFEAATRPIARFIHEIENKPGRTAVYPLAGHSMTGFANPGERISSGQT
jgi:hypothetical protein